MGEYTGVNSYSGCLRIAIRSTECRVPSQRSDSGGACVVADLGTAVVVLVYVLVRSGGVHASCER